MRIAIYVIESGDAYHLPYLHIYATSLTSEAVEVVEYLETSSDMAGRQRPELDQLMSDARQKKFDTVVVWSLDRFGRSARDLFMNISTFDKLGISFFVASIFIDFSIVTSNRTPMGKLVMQMFIAFANLERDLILRRVRAGIAEAKRQGKRCGRPPRAFSRELALELRKGGMSWRAIGRKLGVPQSTVRAALRDVRKD